VPPPGLDLALPKRRRTTCTHRGADQGIHWRDARATARTSYQAQSREERSP
jgi:hypothetical protein